MSQITSSKEEMPQCYPRVSAVGAQRAFSTALVISGIRCVFAYIVLPFVAPVLGLAPGVGPRLGIVIGTVAVVANMFSIRRFVRSNHPLRRPVIAINITVIVFMMVLIAIDVNTVA